MRVAALGQELANYQLDALVRLGLATVEPGAGLGPVFEAFGPAVELTDEGEAFDTAWTIHRQAQPAVEAMTRGYGALPETSALIQGLHGRKPVPVDGALHLLARHGLASPDDVTGFRQFLGVLNDLGIVAYSQKMQTVRVTAPVLDEASEEPPPTLRIVERDRPYSNVRHLRETLRRCRDHIYWVDAHFSRKGLEPLVDEADATLINVINILSGPAQVGEDALKDFKRFKTEMANLGVTAEWRVVQREDQEFHDRFIVTKGAAWNVPPINTLYKGDYSEITETVRPPFERWWAKGAVIGS